MIVILALLLIIVWIVRQMDSWEDIWVMEAISVDGSPPTQTIMVDGVPINIYGGY